MGSVDGFGKKRRSQKWNERIPANSESASSQTIIHIVNKGSLFHILFGLINFHLHQSNGFKSNFEVEKNLVNTVQAKRLYETI